MNMFKAASLGVLSSLALLVQHFSCVDAELDPIVVKGSHFFTKTDGKAFFVSQIPDLCSGEC